MKPPKGKHIFGTVRVGEKGQIVIPKDARKMFDIQPGDSLVVLGDEGNGIAIMKATCLWRRFRMRSFGKRALRRATRRSVRNSITMSCRPCGATPKKQRSKEPYEKRN